MTVLLDTCTFIWLADEQHRLSGVAREVLADPGTTLRLHQASTLEIQIKNALGKLPLPHSPRIAIPQAIKRLGLDYARIEDEEIWHLGKLPHLHQDPFDRLLIAHAIFDGLAIVTPDPLIHQYPVRVIW
ncbi:MAG: type II toxin-antitoxin system VapC family toxin [Verrucomicrobiales bacterium]